MTLGQTQLDIGDLAAKAREFARTLQEVKVKLAPSDHWYPYGSLGNFQFFDLLLTGEDRDLATLAKDKPVADIGGGDGDCGFFLASLGYEVDLIDHAPTNYNQLRGARLVNDALSAQLRIFDLDLDAQFTPPRDLYGLVLALGLLYHLKNPFHFLERLASHTYFALISTRIAAVDRGGSELRDLPVAYLLDVGEIEDDPTNFWIFSQAGLKRILKRTGWEIRSELYVANTGDGSRATTPIPRDDSDPVSADRDERAYMLIRSRRFRPRDGYRWPA